MKKGPKAIVTGVAGFAGSYLAELLLLKGINVFGLVAPKERLDNIYSIKSGLELEQFNVLNTGKMNDFVKKVKPDFVFHLAAMASVGKSFGAAQKVYDVNFNGSLNVFEAASTLKNLSKLIFVSSSDVYGIFKPANKILDENQPLNPISPYGISKVASEYMALYYYRTKNVPIIRIRSFNHSGPKQTTDFVIPSFCSQVAKIEKSGRPGKIKVGDLSARRDFSDVRDIVRGYYLAATRGKPGMVYQLCSGKTVSIEKVLRKLIKMSDSKIKREVNKKLLRKSDIPILRGSNRKAGKELGWFCQFKLEETLKTTLDYWRMKSRNS